MKKSVLFFLFAVLVSLCSTQKANAQVTALTGYFYDSSSNFCNTPADVYGYGYFVVTGTPQANDSVTVYINYGDGSDTSYKVPTVSQTSFAVEHTYLTTGNYQITITLTNTNNVSTTLTGQTYVVSNTCSSLQGMVWLDTDNDCTYDSGEGYMSNYLMKITNTSTSTVYYAWIDQSGMYYAEVPDNYTYTIELANMPGSISAVCPLTGVATQAVSGTATYTNNFGYDCNTSTNTDFSVYGYSNLYRPGFTRFFNIFATTDNFCSTYPATVTLTLDPLLTYSSTTGGTPPTSVVGNVLTWNVSSLSQYNDLMANMWVTCDSFAVLGDTLCNQLIITYSGVTDPNHSNDTFNICRAVSNSNDPNIKTVAQGEGPLAKIANGTELDYMIHFQNNGNDTAYNVVVVDTIESHLDISTLQIVESSHPMTVTILPGNVINFRFENIYLPDSNTNEPLSHGWVAFKITPNTPLPNGTQINNTAHIYFDSNPAVVTNTTLNTIDIPLSVQTVSNGSMKAEVYPNPANDQFTVVTDGIEKFSVQLFDVLGRPVAASSTNNGKTIINTAALSSGMYMLHINANGKQLTTKLHVQH